MGGDRRGSESDAALTGCAFAEGVYTTLLKLALHARTGGDLDRTCLISQVRYTRVCTYVYVCTCVFLKDSAATATAVVARAAQDMRTGQL